MSRYKSQASGKNLEIDCQTDFQVLLSVFAKKKKFYPFFCVVVAIGYSVLDLQQNLAEFNTTGTTGLSGCIGTSPPFFQIHLTLFQIFVSSTANMELLVLLSHI